MNKEFVSGAETKINYYFHRYLEIAGYHITWAVC